MRRTDRVQELNLEFPDRDPNDAPTRKAERGEVKKLGPQLPLRRPRLKERVRQLINQ